MASHQIAIAKASFSAGLLRPDPSSVPRDDIAAFHTALDRVLNHCSPANIQTCKAWLLHYVAYSANRVGGLAKYLVALAGFFEEPAAAGADASAGPSAGTDAGPGARSKTSVKRRRLHILYLLNDLFHHSKYHLDTTTTFSTVSGSLQPYMVDLLGHAAAYDQQKHPRHHRRLDDLLDIWSEHGYFGPELVYKLREVVKNSASMGAAPSSSTDVLIDETDAAKKLPGKEFLAGPADQSLIQALKGFLEEVDQIYGAEELVKDDGNMDIDELGQRVTRDEISGETLDGDTYYGWSRAFCQQMKRRPDQSRSRSRSHSRSRGSLKRRRYSDSSLSQGSRRSDSLSRSRSRTGHREARGYDSPSRSRSRSRRRSRTRESSYTPREPSPPRFPPPHHPLACSSTSKPGCPSTQRAQCT
ncbi:uncharacterized protein N7482_002720 [Penicillium canariense]|uniref:CID domain-containing protein n=1 Tax=Penicillium canariense TaxID=189055 RepID=A0A9W9IFR8_9EURO|nr:uncharacterized protein N7482_002720 [Penicillium canariense]KAJ5176843.1 hypothetical protein N7482_002720 [Penicillium canariense]